MARSKRRAETGIDEEATTFRLERPDEAWVFTRFAAGAVGTLYVTYGIRGVRSIDFERTPAMTGEHERKRAPAWLSEPLGAYLRGEKVDLSRIPLDLGGTAFQRRVWEALQRIPWGRVASYAHVASEVGSPRGMRAVGMANARNPVPLLVPCHRVIESSGGLGGYSGGLDKKIALLALEGVTVEKGHVLPGQLDLFTEPLSARPKRAPKAPKRAGRDPRQEPLPSA
ncbi:MAG: methylated-DNA--[protein]-cysteine S-methyltransferase [Polyangiales bacterium]